MLSYIFKDTSTYLSMLYSITAKNKKKKLFTLFQLDNSLGYFFCPGLEKEPCEDRGVLFFFFWRSCATLLESIFFSQFLFQQPQPKNTINLPSWRRAVCGESCCKKVSSNLTCWDERKSIINFVLEVLFFICLFFFSSLHKFVDLARMLEFTKWSPGHWTQLWRE